MAPPNKKTYRVVERAAELSFLSGKTVTSVVEYENSLRVYYTLPNGKGEHINIEKNASGSWSKIKSGNSKNSPGNSITSADKTRLDALKAG